MKIIGNVFVIGLFVAISHVAFAEGECDKYTKSYDKTYCYCKLFIESDTELNGVYKDLKNMLKEDTKKRVTEIQREWMKYRDHVCEDTPGEIDVECNYKVNKERTEYLRDRLRECKTGNCREDMIAQKSWK